MSIPGQLINGVFIDQCHKSHNASVKYPTMHHLVTEMCTHVDISLTKWCVVGYGNGALWDLWDRSIGGTHQHENVFRAANEWTSRCQWLMGQNGGLGDIVLGTTVQFPSVYHMRSIVGNLTTVAYHLVQIRFMARGIKWNETNAEF